MPAPRDPAKLAELTQIASRMEGMYGAGSYCTGEGDAKVCRQLGELEDVLRVLGAKRWDVLTKVGLPRSIFAVDGPRQLALVTCGGPVISDGATRHYRDNVVLTAVPASG